jgi:hypothetical protein
MSRTLTKVRLLKVFSALVGHLGVAPSGKLYRRSPQCHPCVLGCCSIAPWWEADKVPVSPLRCQSSLGLSASVHFKERGLFVSTGGRRLRCRSPVVFELEKRELLLARLHPLLLAQFQDVSPQVSLSVDFNGAAAHS